MASTGPAQIPARARSNSVIGPARALTGHEMSMPGQIPYGPQPGRYLGCLLYTRVGIKAHSAPRGKPRY